MPEKDRPTLLEVLTELPLLSELDFRMQVTNIAMVDLYLEDMESALVRELHLHDKTPVPEAMLVGALSQMWVFAVYELLRTWRQLIQELLAYGEEIKDLRGHARTQRIGAEERSIRGVRNDGPAVLGRRRALEWARTKRKRERLAKALDRVMPLFRRLEALRISIAKHEVAKTNRGKGRANIAFAPTYARIDPIDGSIKWLFDYADGMSDMVSRREIADDLRSLRRGGTTVGPPA